MAPRESNNNFDDSTPAMDAESQVDPTTDESTDTQESPTELQEKNPAAVLLGRLGGQKGGKARARKLSATRRSEIARHAANARWKREPRP